MRVTEGWDIPRDIVPSFGCTVCDAEEIPGGMRVLISTAPIPNRGATLNKTLLTAEITVCGESSVSVRVYQFAGLDPVGPRYPLAPQERPYTVTIGPEEACLTVDRLTVRVIREKFAIRFEGDEKLLTSCAGARGLGYLRVDPPVEHMTPGPHYLDERWDPYLRCCLGIDPDEHIYGLGERFTPFVRNGQSVSTWNEDGGTDTDIAYKCVPFYQSDKGYGVFVDHSEDVSFQVGSERVKECVFTVPGEEMRFCFFYGPSPAEVLDRYTALTGRPALPPAWSFGLWLSTSFLTDYNEETVTSMIRGMQERDIPLSVFHFDCFWMKEFTWCSLEWDETQFPDVRGMIAHLHELGVKVNVWINPYIAQNTAMFREGVQKGYFLRRGDGKGVYQTNHWQPGMALVDFTNPEAEAWYSDRLTALLDMGVDAFKTDFGERIPTDVTYFDGSDPRAMHNYYAYLYNKCVFRTLERKRGKGEAVLFARSATTGCQQFPVHWGGDCTATFASMAETLRGGLSFAMSGFPFWSHDISGFGWTATEALYNRWVAFGLLSSHSRLHGSSAYKVPWKYGESCSEVLRFFTRLKCRLMPYLYGLAVRAHAHGEPLLRPMVFDYPKDPAVAYLDKQYMLGPDLLVAPVFNDAGTTDVYLPEGKWIHLLSGEERTGGRYYHDTWDYFSLPLFVRGGSLLPVGECETRPDYDYPHGLTLRLYALEDGGTATVSVPDVQGSIRLTATARRTGSEVLLTYDGPEAPALECVGMPGVTARVIPAKEVK